LASIIEARAAAENVVSICSLSQSSSRISLSLPPAAFMQAVAY
jgi:hypothetical protein